MKPINKLRLLGKHTKLWLFRNSKLLKRIIPKPRFETLPSEVKFVQPHSFLPLESQVVVGSSLPRETN